MVYFVIGEDGRRYGPVDLATLKLWASQDRVRAYTLVESAADGSKFPAERVPGLVFGASTNHGPRPLPYPAGVDPTALGQYPTVFPMRDTYGNSGLATASLLLGLVGFFGVCCMGALAIPPSLLAVIFGHMGTRSSNSGQAIGGLVLGYLGLVFGALLFLAYLFMRLPG